MSTTKLARRRKARDTVNEWRMRNEDRPVPRDVDRLLVEALLRHVTARDALTAARTVVKVLAYCGYDETKSKVVTGTRLNLLKKSTLQSNLARLALDPL